MHALRRAATILLLALPVRLPAQLLVHVESHRFPVSNVEIGVWNASRRLAAGRTDITGSAILPLAAAERAGATLVLRRLGYAPARIVLGRADTMSVQLEAVATELPALAVTQRSLRCPAPMEPAAESLWTAAASRYHMGAFALFFAWRGTVRSETVHTDERGYGDDWGPVQHDYGAYTPAPDRPDNLMVDPPPYARWDTRRSGAHEERRWRYALLESIAAAHFASARFLGVHTLQLLGRSADATVIGFCPVGDEPTGIEGELQLSDDGEIRGARWQFRVDHDDEDAGGEATFASATFEGNAYLFALRGASWRRARKGLYNQERFERTAWRFGRTLGSVEIPADR